MKVIIGLTGNIAAGKSTVSNILRDYGAVVVDADEIARKTVEKNQPALEEIIRTFGRRVVKSDGTLNRSTLGKIVFSDPEQLKKLNSIMHPLIISQIMQEIGRFMQSERKILTIDAALLFETDLDKLVDQVWYVDTTEELQLERLIRRNHYTHEEALQRIHSQDGSDRKKHVAQVVIQNDNTLEALECEVLRHIRKLSVYSDDDEMQVKDRTV